MMKFRRGTPPDRGVLAGLAEPGRLFLPDIPTGLMLKPVMGAGQNDSRLIPNNMLMMHESDAQQTIENLARKRRGVPDICHLKTRHKLKSLRPIGSRVPGNCCLGMTRGATLHVTRLGGAVTIQAGAVTPFRIELDPVGRVSHHEGRLSLAQQMCDIFGT